MKGKVRDKKIVIYLGRDISEHGAMPKTEYQPIHSGKLWAYVRQTSADEVYSAYSTHSTESMIFVIAWRDDIISTKHYVEYKGVFYNIKRVDTFEGYKGSITITADKMASQPERENILTY